MAEDNTIKIRLDTSEIPKDAKEAAAKIKQAMSDIRFDIKEKSQERAEKRFAGQPTRETTGEIIQSKRKLLDLSKQQDKYREILKQQTSGVSKVNDMYSKYRKALTGVLIDLHMLRIVGQSSKVVAASFQMISQALGYLLDVILMPLLPYMVKFAMGIYKIASWFSHLDKRLKIGIAMVVGFGVALAAVASTVVTVIGALSAFSLALTGATTAVSAHGVSQAGGGLLAGGAVSGGALVGGTGLLGLGAATLYLNAAKKAGWSKEKGFNEAFAATGLPHFAAGGIASGPTNAIVGEGGPEAIIPLDKIGETLGNLVGGAGGFVKDVFSNIFGGAAMGTGGGGGVGLTTGDPVKSLLAKGFTMNATAVTTGFKTSNMLVAAIIALMGGKGGGGGDTTDPVATFIGKISAFFSTLVTALEVAWGSATDALETALETVVTVFETGLTSIVNTIVTTTETAWQTIIGKESELNNTTIAKVNAAWDNIIGSTDRNWNAVSTKYVAVADALFARLITNTPQTNLPSPNQNTPPVSAGGGIPSWNYVDPTRNELNQRIDANMPVFGGTQYSGSAAPWNPLETMLAIAGVGSIAAGVGSAAGALGGLSIFGAAASDLGAGPPLANMISGTNTVPNKAIPSVDWFGAGGTATQWAYMDANERQKIVDSGRTYTIGGIQYQNGRTVTEGLASTIYDASGNYIGPSQDSGTTMPGAEKNYSAGIHGFPPGVTSGTAVQIGNAWYSSSGTLIKKIIFPGYENYTAIDSYQNGGMVKNTGLAYLHAGEQVIPSDKAGSGGGINIYNPTFQISGKDDRQMFESFMRLMKLESNRVR